MGAGAAVIAGQIVASVVVSVVASKVASSLGMGDTMSGLVGMGAGLYAGGAVGEAMGGGLGTGADAGTGLANDQIGMDLASGMTQPLAGDTMAPSAALSGQAPTTGKGMIPGPIQGVQAPNPAPPMIQSGSQPGMLSKATAAPPVTSAPPPVQSNPLGPAGEQSWFDKVMSSGKTMDTLVGAAGGLAQGWAQGKALEDQNKAQWDREDDQAKAWGNSSWSGPGLAYPNKARSGMLTRGM